MTSLHFIFRIFSFDLQFAALWWGILTELRLVVGKELMGVQWGRPRSDLWGEECSTPGGLLKSRGMS